MGQAASWAAIYACGQRTRTGESLSVAGVANLLAAAFRLCSTWQTMCVMLVP
jgi:hypothetical protein